MWLEFCLQTRKLFQTQKQSAKLTSKSLQIYATLAPNSSTKKALKFLDGYFKVRISSYKNSKLDKGRKIMQTTVPKPKDNISTENLLLARLTIVPEKSSDIWKIVPKVFRAAEKNKIQILIFQQTLIH